MFQLKDMREGVIQVEAFRIKQRVILDSYTVLTSIVLQCRPYNSVH